MKDDGLYLTHIRECLDRIAEYAAGGKEEFLETRLVQDAVLRNLQTLCESTQRLSEEFKVARPEVPWRNLAGFRNVVVHNYLGIDLETVWGIVERDLPVLRRNL